jgi:uncharacterized membrane protein HdeD (DUF308 family)
MASPKSEESEGRLPHANEYGWRGFILLGIAFVMLGTAAIVHIQIAAMISTFVLGLIVLIGGLLGLGLATRVRDTDSHFFWVLTASLYLLAGIALLAGPFMSERALSLVIAGGLSLAGLSRLVAGARLQCTPVLISGAATIIVATVIGIGWQRDLLWVLGYALAGDFIVYGVTLAIAGEQLHRSISPGRSVAE